MRQAPRFAGWSLTAAEELAAGPALVRLSPALPHRSAGEPSTGGLEHGPAPDELGRAARHTPVGTLVVDGDASISPQDGARAAVVCRGTTCGLPGTDPAQLPRSAQG